MRLKIKQITGLTLMTALVAALLTTACSKPDNRVVLETMDSGGYTYARLYEKGEETWIAGPKVIIKVGDKVTWQSSQVMPNFKSKTLNRQFDRILFVNKIINATKYNHTTAQSNTQLKVKPGEVVKPAGALSIEQIHAGKDKLAGQTVTVTGRVIKYNPGIMGKNWVHIQDGSGSVDSHNFDLLVTTQQTAKVGMPAVIKGKVVKDKDFGAGYSYKVLLEEGDIKEGKLTK